MVAGHISEVVGRSRRVQRNVKRVCASVNQYERRGKVTDNGGSLKRGILYSNVYEEIFQWTIFL